MEATEVRECGVISDKKRLCVAAHNASACDGLRNAAIIADGRLEFFFKVLLMCYEVGIK